MEIQEFLETFNCVSKNFQLSQNIPITTDQNFLLKFIRGLYFTAALCSSFSSLLFIIDHPFLKQSLPRNSITFAQNSPQSLRNFQISRYLQLLTKAVKLFTIAFPALHRPSPSKVFFLLYLSTTLSSSLPHFLSSLHWFAAHDLTSTQRKIDFVVFIWLLQLK